MKWCNQHRAGFLLASLLTLAGLHIAVWERVPLMRAQIAKSSARPRLVVQTRHAGATDAVAISPDGKVIVTGSADGTACLWYAPSGRQIRCLLKQEAGIKSVDYSSDGKVILTALEQEGIIRLWNPETGEQLRQFGEQGTDKTLQFALFSPDAQYVLTGGSFNTVILWKTATGDVVRRFAPVEEIVKRDIKMNPNPFSWPSAGAFSLDGHLIVVGGTNGVAHIWETDSGNYQRALAVLPAPVHAIAFSPDTKTLLVGGSDSSSAQHVVGAVQWRIETGQVERLFKHDQVVTALAFSRDGRMIMTASDGVADLSDGYVRLWDAQTGAQLRTIKPVLQSEGAHAVVFSGDGQRVLMTEYRGASLWDTSSGKLTQHFAPYSESIDGAAVSRDGTFLALRGAQTSVWDLEQGREIWRDSSGGHSLSFSPDGKQLLAGSRLFDTASGEELKQFRGEKMYPDVSAMSPDGRLVVAAGGDVVGGSTEYQLIEWDAQTGRELRHLIGHDLNKKNINTIQFSADSKRIITSGDDFTARLWDADTGRQLQQYQLEGTPGPFIDTIAALSPDGSLVLTVGDVQRTAKLWNTETGQLVRELKGQDGYIESATFAPDGNTIVTADDREAIIWETQTGNLIRRLPGHVGDINALAFRSNGRILITTGNDGTARFWSMATGEEICQLSSFDMVIGTTADRGDRGWVVAAPDGRFDSNTLFDIRSLQWVLPDEPLKPLPLEVFMRDYYEPGLLARLLAGEKLPEVPDLLRVNRLAPIVKITQIKPEPPIAPDTVADQVSVTVQVTNVTEKTHGIHSRAESGVFDLQLFRDGQLVAYAPQSEGAVTLNSDGKAEITFSHIKLAHRGPRKVVFAAYAFNKDRIKSETDQQTYEIPARLKWLRGRAYIISIGVNAYENADWNLKYAANDAREIQKTLTAQLSQTGEFEEVVPISLISDYEAKDGQTVVREKSATKTNVKAVLDLLAGKPVNAETVKTIANADRLRAATPDDLFIITFSSHGYADAKGSFFFIPYDMGTETKRGITADLLRRAISSEELGAWLRDVDAGEMVMIVDACHSAASVEGEGFKPAPMGSRGLGQLSYDKGMRILTSTQSDDVALETEVTQQGLLTYALTHDGIGQREADFKPRDGTIRIVEWLQYAVQRVPQLYSSIMQADDTAGASGLKDIKVGNQPPTKVIVFSRDGANSSFKKGVSQQPSLFDFTRKGRDLVLVNTH